MVTATTASWAGQGADVLVGGPGNDAAYYASSAAAVTVNLLDGTGTGGDAEGDTLDSIENLSGSAFDDSRSPAMPATTCCRAAPAPTHWTAGDGTDTVSYSGSSAGVTVNLLTGAGERGDAQGDRLSNIENLIGSRYNDDLTGDTGNNVLRGGAGDDVLIGGAGADRLQGGTGQDTVSYAGSPRRRHRAPAQPGGRRRRCHRRHLSRFGGCRLHGSGRRSADLSSLPDIEHLTGSAHNDILAGRPARQRALTAVPATIRCTVARAAVTMS